MRATLAANPAACTLAYWHYPLFSSGPERQPCARCATSGAFCRRGRRRRAVRARSPLRAFCAAGRQWPRRSAAAASDSSWLEREAPTCTARGSIQPNSEAISSTFGVLKLTLKADQLPVAVRTDSRQVPSPISASANATWRQPHRQGRSATDRIHRCPVSLSTWTVPPLVRSPGLTPAQRPAEPAPTATTATASRNLSDSACVRAITCTRSPHRGVVGIDAERARFEDTSRAAG